LIVQVLTEYSVDPEVIIEDNQSLWEEYRRTESDDPEEFVMWLLDEFIGFGNDGFELVYENITRV
jgi:hypothetical protein